MLLSFRIKIIKIALAIIGTICYYRIVSYYKGGDSMTIKKAIKNLVHHGLGLIIKLTRCGYTGEETITIIDNNKVTEKKKGLKIEFIYPNTTDALKYYNEEFLNRMIS